MEFPLRDHKDQAEIIVREIGDVQYPLSLHDRLHYGQRFRQDVEDFTSALKTIEEKFASPSDKLPKHTEGPDCRRCRMKKKDLATAYRKFFLGSESDADQNARWDNRLMSYREKVEKLMESEDDLTLEGIEQVQALFKTELSKHNRKDLCTPQAGDPEYILILKRETAERLLAGLSFEDTLQIALAAQEQFSNLPSIGPDAQKLINFLQDPKNAQNAASAYQEYYCTIKPDDTPQQRSIKSKYSVTFGKGEPHDEVLEKWKKEALEIQAKETKDLKAQKVDLERAQKGHLRRQNGKKTEKDRRRREREMKATAEAYAERKQRMANCAMSSCEREIDLLAGDGPLECVVCDWLASKTPKGGGEGLREHAYYCSEEHVEDHFVSVLLRFQGPSRSAED